MYRTVVTLLSQLVASFAFRKHSLSQKCFYEHEEDIKNIHIKRKKKKKQINMLQKRGHFSGSTFLSCKFTLHTKKKKEKKGDYPLWQMTHLTETHRRHR